MKLQPQIYDAVEDYEKQTGRVAEYITVSPDAERVLINEIDPRGLALLVVCKLKVIVDERISGFGYTLQ